jgi:arylsulfatase A-like enzyme
VRQGDWKLVDRRDFEAKTNSGWQLYNLSQDIAEEQNLAAAHPQRVAELSRAWDEWNARNITPIWRGTPNEDPR